MYELSYGDIAIYREKIGLTGYKTIERIAFVTRYEAAKVLEGKTIIRRFNSPFDASIECIVIE